MKISVIPETFCPSCRVTMNDVHETHGEDSEPIAGDVVICENCGDLSVLGDDLQMLPLNADERMEFELRPEIINWQLSVQQLKQESGKGLFVGGVKLPLALAELGLIDEYEFVVQPRLAGHGPTLFAGLSKHVDLKLVSRLEFGSGAVAMRYEPRR